MIAALVHVYPKLLLALLAAWTAAAAWASPSLLRRARKAPVLGLILLLGLGLRLFCIAPAHQVYYDEFEHLDISRRMADRAIFAETAAGGLPEWDVYLRPPWPGGHHAALGAFMAAAGTETSRAFLWSALLSSLTLLLVFWASPTEKAGLAAAFAWAVLPPSLRFAGAADLTSASLFWSAAALAAVLVRRREGASLALDALACLSLAYAPQVRPENALLLPFASAAGLPLRLVLPGALGLAFPAAVALLNARAGVPGYAAVPALEHVLSQAARNAWYLLTPAALGTLLLPAALWSARRSRESRALLALAGAYVAVYSCFYHGAFAAGADDRYALAAALPLLLAAAPALGLFPLPAAAAAALLAWPGPRPADPAHAASRVFLAEAASTLPPNTFILSRNPSFVREAAARPSSRPRLLLEDPAGFAARAERAGAAKGFAVYEDWAWRSRPDEAAETEALLRRLRLKPAELARLGPDRLVYWK